MPSRRKAHFAALREQKHTCAALQLLFDEHGEESLSWSVLALAPTALAGWGLARWLNKSEVEWGNACAHDWAIIVRTSGYGVRSTIGPTVVVSAEVPESFRDDLDKRAAKEQRSRARLIFRALRFYLAHAPVVPARDDEIPPPKGEKK